jgi:hypothetical protein
MDASYSAFMDASWMLYGVLHCRSKLKAGSRTTQAAGHVFQCKTAVIFLWCLSRLPSMVPCGRSIAAAWRDGMLDCSCLAWFHVDA